MPAYGPFHMPHRGPSRRAEPTRSGSTRNDDGSASPDRSRRRTLPPLPCTPARPRRGAPRAIVRSMPRRYADAAQGNTGFGDLHRASAARLAATLDQEGCPPHAPCDHQRHGPAARPLPARGLQLRRRRRRRVRRGQRRIGRHGDGPCRLRRGLCTAIADFQTDLDRQSAELQDALGQGRHRPRI